MQIKKVSFRKRLITTGLILSVFMTGFILYVYLLVSKTSSDNITNIESSQKISQIINKINEQLRKTEGDIYKLAILPDPKHQKSLENNYTELLNLSIALNQIPYEKFKSVVTSSDLHQEHYSGFRTLSTQLSVSVIKLQDPLLLFAETAVNIEKRYPGMPVLLDELLPRNNTFLEAVDLAIIETKQSSARSRLKEKTLNLFNDARYLWTQQANWIRLFVSNRYGIFGESMKSMEHSLQNRTLYMGEVKKVIAKLDVMDKKGQLELQQSLSLEEMSGVIEEYEYFFIKTRDIYISPEWRKDLNLLTYNLRPSLLKVWNGIRELEKILNIHNRHSINQSQSTSSMVSIFVLIIGASIFLTFAIGYYLFEKMIRKPLVGVANALDAEAKGESLNLPLQNYATETDVLIKAFANMKEQVHFRELRLSSILDNAAEGIITMDENCKIETFNIASQMLFGYELDEVLGKDISILIPVVEGNIHGSTFIRMNADDKVAKLGLTQEVTAKSKNGLTFPMSIKISDMHLGDKRFFTAVVENISQRKAMIENLQSLAEHDSLTGLYNRHYFMDELDKFVIRKKRGDKNYAVLLYIDLDNFKYVNDTMGHMAGDELLIEASSLLKSRTRDSDILARLGGDEFAIILFRPDPMHIEETADSFRKQLEDYVFKYDGKIASIGCSIGAATLDENILSKEDLLAKADFACHEAKRMGRNQIHIYNPEDDQVISDMSIDVGWTNRIKNALENDSFVLAYQPIHNIALKENEYSEVLIRMLDEKNNLIMPGGFLPAAERFGFMVQIDAWVIKNSLHYIANQPLQNNIKLSINLSASSIEDESIFKLIKNTISELKIDAENIIFEVTESIAMANIQKASNVLKELQMLGCKTALDDFGVGYSSFAYLNDLPIDIIKIDGGFVKDIAENSLHLAMVRSINDIAHEMGKVTVAEFVEDEKCLNILSELNVDYGQGYFIGKPEIVESDEKAKFTN